MTETNEAGSTGQEDGGPAFPGEQGHIPDGTWNQTWDPGMSLRQYAAIQLRVPKSGIDWLDEMIRKARRDDVAARAMAGIVASQQCEELELGFETVADLACRQADAMAERESMTKETRP